MKLAFCIFKYFPYGGLQRDMYRAIEIALERGHEVDVYTMYWEGAIPAGATIRIISASGITNHGRAKSFGKKLRKIFNLTLYDRVVGFNKIPGLDIYFTGENCFAKNLAEKAIPFIRFFPRYFVFSALEKQLFCEKSNTEILLISPKEKEVYQKFYHTRDNRFHFLLPGIEKKSFCDQDIAAIRSSTRKLYNIAEHKIWLLFVASDYALKGLGRVLEAILAADELLSKKIILSVVGHDKSDGYQTFLRRHHVKTRVDFFGASDDVYKLMSSADLLVHPAKLELAGKVLLEAMINYLPILTTSICGCAFYVEESQGGKVLPEPYSQAEFMQSLLQLLEPSVLDKYKHNLMHYKINDQIYRSHQQLVDYVEKINMHYIRDFYVDASLKSVFPENKKACIDYVFSLEGEVYRQVKSRKTISTTMKGKDYFIKMHRGVGWREILKNILVFKSAALGAKQEYKAIREMEKANILVPEVCAYATDGINPARINSFIMTKRIYYQHDLEKLCQTWSKTPPSFVFKRRIISRVAEIARKMHQAGMNHRDFYLCHLLLDQRSELDFDLYLIDLHRVQIRKRVPMRWKVKDLSGLYFSAMDIGLTRLDGYYFLEQYYQLPIKTILKKKRILWWWIDLKAKMLFRRHQNKRLHQ